METLINILFSSNFGMQISAKIWDILKNNKNLNPLKIQRNISFWISLESK